MCIENYIQVIMYYVSAQGVDVRMINVHYYYYLYTYIIIIYIPIGMHEWVKFYIWKCPRNSRCTHAYITQLYIMSIEPVNKAAEHLINSYDQYWKSQKKRKKKKRIMLVL